MILKKIIRSFLCLAFLCSSISVYAGTNIGLGIIKGYKIGDGDAESIMVYLNDGYRYDDGDCKGVVRILFSDFNDTSRSKSRLELIMSTVLAAYMSNKSVRFHSHKNNCDVTFVALQESYF